MHTIKIKKPNADEASEINSLIIDVFISCVAPDYSQEGINFFLNICNQDQLLEKVNEPSPIYVAKIDKNIVGVIWTRDMNHISRYFVHTAYQKKGIGKMLFNSLLSEIISNHKEITEISVNSSPCAVGAYEKMGFIKIGEEKLENGIRFIPLLFKINSRHSLLS